ncbi:MAG TPA: prephenate dehydratase domain-containing protein [Polyangiaceae bacterium]|jgi:chorismate mutase/prephenate dehydratase|nr:prephenate dehydratase domain-containing protein [Polyangiaceae bacterium]
MADERRDGSDLRDKLAEIDRAILAQLDARARVSKGLAARAGGEPGADVGEREWAESLVRAGSGDMPAESVRAVFGQIRAASRALEQPVAIAYVGPEGGFCHEAALQHFGASARLVSSLGVAEALAEVVRGRVGVAVFPFESSVDGLVQPTITALAETDLMMVGERVLSASIDLMAKTPDLGAVEHVYATALGQAACQRFLDAELPRASVIDVRSPVVAAELAREEPKAAALVSERVGRAASLEPVRANVGDEPDLKLRYGFASARPAMRSGNDVTCLLFSVDDAPGSLFGVLKHFADRGVNLRKLQSRPVAHGTWDYVFYVELGAHVTERPVTTALEAIKRSTKYLKVLGSFPVATG